jgi:Protein phosphatase 2C
MLTKILCLVFCMLGILPAKAQPGANQELRYLYQRLDSLACKTKIAEYKKNVLGELKLTSLEKDLAQLDTANSGFKKKLGSNCKPLGMLIKNIDSSIEFQKHHLLSAGDTAALLNGLAYLRNKSWGYVEIDLHFTNKSDRPVNPSITIEPSLSSMLNKNEHDTTAPYELYVFPSSAYEIAAQATGYETSKVSLNNIKADTGLVIVMKSVNTDNGNSDTGKPANNEEEKKSHSNPYVWLSIILGAFLLILLTRQLLTKSHKTSSVPASSPGDPVVASIKTTYTSQMKQAKDPVDGKAYFLSEIMMTAGPRKKPADQANADRDLGEDVCGFVMDSDHVLLWVLDGASDYFSEKNPDTGREYFSSRLLAQSIAGKLKQQFAAINAASFKEIVTGIIAAVRMDWVKMIGTLPTGEIEALKNSVKDGRFPECAATILIAKLSLAGGLQVYRSGDCKLFLYREESGHLKHVPSSLSKKNSTSNDWLFFRIVEANDGSLDILHNTPLFEVVSETGIQTIIGISDGIGMETVESLSKNQPGDSDDLRMILTQQVQGTGDDKSLCMIEIKKE